jgi:hypothetical protein
MTDEERFERFWRRFEKNGCPSTKNEMRKAFLEYAEKQPAFRDGEIAVIEDGVRSRITYLPDNEIGLARKLNYEEVATILAPPEAKFCAVDMSGVAYFYLKEPKLDGLCWDGSICRNCYEEFLSFTWDHPDWKNSLFKLPSILEE